MYIFFQKRLILHSATIMPEPEQAEPVDGAYNIRLTNQTQVINYHGEVSGRD